LESELEALNHKELFLFHYI